MSSRTNLPLLVAEEPVTGFADKVWQVHKFGGTSVADSDCFLRVASICEDLVKKGAGDLSRDATTAPLNLAVVVSAMGGKPKVTDLLLSTVVAAAARQHDQVEAILQQILDKHKTCIDTLFEQEQDRQELLQIIESDLDDVRDILKTVSLMKWQATRISELISGNGELWSAQILCKLLKTRAQNNDAYVFLDARRVITIDEEAVQNGAVCWDICQKQLQQVYEEEVASPPNQNASRLHFVITGYVASNTHGVATTLQRDGSDYSASIMGKLLSSTNITIWTDVDGVLSADPRRVPSAHVIPEVSFDEAMELAYFGAKVVHPKTMQPAISANPQIPIYIRNTFRSHLQGSRIFTTSTTETDRDKCVCGFSSIENMALVNVEGSGFIGVPGVAKRLFGTLENLGINVIMISQASSEHSITFATLERQAEAAKLAIEDEFHRELSANRISKVDIKAPCSVIGAVGDGMHAMAGVSGRFFSALGNAKINVLAISQGCSERNISAVVWAHESTRALRAVHAAFRLSKAVVRIAVIGMNQVGESLVTLLQSQRKRIYDVFEVDLQVVVISSDGLCSELVCLNGDYDGDVDSINLTAYSEATFDESTLLRQETGGSPVAVVSGGLDVLSNILVSDECAHHVVFDCTAEPAVSARHAEWLREGIHVVTANNTGLSGTKEQRTAIAEAEKIQGKLSAKYCNEVTVGGALPIISTLRGLLNSGDSIRRIDGILSTAMSFIMFRISPSPRMMESSEFDKACSNGHFTDVLTMMPSDKVGVACPFSQAVREARALGLMEDDPNRDLDNMYSARSVMILANELGLNNRTAEDIAYASDKLVESSQLEGINFDSKSENQERMADIDRMVRERVVRAEAKGCCLRSIASVDVKTQRTEIKLVEVPDNHIFAITPPSCECFRFFTHRYLGFPLIVQGPAAGADSTASALLAEKLRLIHEQVIDFTKVEAGSGALTKAG